jgi:hypothetical protein
MTSIFKTPKPPALPPAPEPPSKKEIAADMNRRRPSSNNTVKTSALGIVDAASRALKTKLGA